MTLLGGIAKSYVPVLIPLFTKIEKQNAFWARAVARWVNTHNVVANTNVIRDAVDKIDQSIREGRKVLIVAHSQGNLYMNNIYQSLDDDDKYYVRLLSVATPASYVGKVGVSYPYVSRYDDLVVKGTPRSLPPSNVQPTLFDDGIFAMNHNFVTRYLDDPPLCALIQKYSLAQIEDHVKPYVLGKYNKVRGSVIVQAMGYPAYSYFPTKNDFDVDLHIFEPGNTHVYFASYLGDAGYIDWDSNGYYFTESGLDYYKIESYAICPKYSAKGVPASGIYYVALNYFACPADYYSPTFHDPDHMYGDDRNDWDLRANVDVTLIAGPKILRLSYYMPAPRGPMGSGNPIIVASIEVTKKNGKPRYKLQKLR